MILSGGLYRARSGAEQSVRDPFESYAPRCFHKDDVVSVQARGQHANGRIDIVDEFRRFDLPRRRSRGHRRRPRRLGRSPSSAASRPTSRWACSLRSPSSSISPSTATGRPCPMPATARSAAAIDSGLALYASLMTTRPSARTWCSMRIGERGAGCAQSPAIAVRSSASRDGGGGRGGGVDRVVRADLRHVDLHLVVLVGRG